MSLLLPAGVDSLYDLPHNIFHAIRQALFFLGFDELAKDETPDSSIWLEPKEMKRHWKKVESIRRAKYGGKGDRYGDEPIEGDVEYNDAAKELYG